jgi:hypothetical protein
VQLVSKSFLSLSCLLPFLDVDRLGGDIEDLLWVKGQSGPDKGCSSGKLQLEGEENGLHQYLL